MVRSAVFALVAAAAALAPTLSVAGEPLTVVELFTSQGCSSCPPADALIGELAGRDDVLALSEHVDYWDYLGWKDPFALAATTQRQRDYARRLGLGYVYTPQIVIQGAEQVTGSNRAAIMARLDQPEPPPQVDVAVGRADAGRFTVSISGTPVDEAADVWLVMFDKQHATRVIRGENRGREMHNYNVVRSFNRIGSWNGNTETFTATMPDSGDGGDACAVIVQTRNTGRILGPARLDLTGT